MRKRVFSGMRPTGQLHLGHLVGALENWVKLQEEYDCIFGIVDWHALMSEYENSQEINHYIAEMALDWIACGLDPNRSVIFVQSHVPEHLELSMIFGCLTPLGWLERNPTYKEQLREIKTRDLQTFGFLGYPVLQAADILVYKAQAVPIGEDQLPHIELTREIARKFNHTYQSEVFSDCEGILTQTPRLLGIDNRKMSKSYNNAINLSDDQETVRKKIQSMVTDPQRIRKTDPGHPDICNVYCYYKVFYPEKTEEVCRWCTKAEKGCTQCKQILADKMIEILTPIQQRRSALGKDKDRIQDILAIGAKKARAIAQETMKEVRKVVLGL